MRFSRLFLKICKWVLVKMSLNCKHSGVNGKIPANSKAKKAKEASSGSNGGWNGRRLLLLVWVPLVVTGFIWFLTGLSDGVLRREVESRNMLEVKALVLLEFFNASKEQLNELIYFFFRFDKNTLQTKALVSLARELCDSLSSCLVKICSSVIVVMAVVYKIPGLIEKLWRKRNQNLVLQPKQKEQVQASSRSAGKWRKKLLIVFVLAGVTLSIWLFWHMNTDISFKRKETLASMCDERARMLQDQFNVSMNHVHALAILVSTFHHGKVPSAIDQKTFGEYAESTSFERPLTSGVAYALRVRHSEREQFEKKHGWTIKKMEIEDQTLVQDCNPENLDPSPVQDEYAPVIFSQETVSHIVSIDMMSGKVCFIYLMAFTDLSDMRARASGKGVLTSPFKLLKSNHLGVVLTFAVYNTRLPPDITPEQRINATVGYLGASYDVPSLVERLLHQLASKQTSVVNVYDTINTFEAINMYGSTNVTDTGLLHISSLYFEDPARKHEMHCRFKQKPSPPVAAMTT